MRTLTLPLLAAMAAFALPARADDAQWLAEARQTASALPPKLITRLMEEISRSGMDGAIAVCRDMAPQMAREVTAQTGWSVRRVSLKTRNEQRATPDAWERAALEEFDRRAAAGEDPARIEKGETVVEAGRHVYRYMKALPVQPLCLNCHGPADQWAPGVGAKLAEAYPHDHAVGYSVGQLRGAVSVRKGQ